MERGVGAMYEGKVVETHPDPKDVYVVIRGDGRVVVTDSERDARRALRVKNSRLLEKYGNVLEIPRLPEAQGIYRLGEVRRVLEDALVKRALEDAKLYHDMILMRSARIVRRIPIVEDPAVRVFDFKNNYFRSRILPGLRRKALRRSVIELEAVDEYGIKRRVELLEFKNRYGVWYTSRYYECYVSIKKSASVDDFAAAKLDEFDTRVLAEVMGELKRACSETNDLCRTVLELLAQAYAVAELMR